MATPWLASAKSALTKADGPWKFGLAAVGLFFSVSSYQWARQDKLDKLEEQWSSISPAQEQLQLVREFRRKHATADDPQHYADVMYEYYTALREGTGGAQPEHAREVAQARRDQQVFWDKFLGRKHQWVPFLPLEFLGGFESMMPQREGLDTKQSRWSRRAGEYQTLFEPVDIANWYAKRIHEDEYGH